MSFDVHDRALLRDLAWRIAEAAALPSMAVRRRKWVEHNALRSRYPLMLVFPEGSWVELLPPTALACHDEAARAIERSLRMRLYTCEHFQDDFPVDAEWVERAVIADGGWGFERQRRHSDSARGAYAIEPVLAERGDLRRLHLPELIYDEQATQRNLAVMHDLLGDILTVRPKGRHHFHYSLASQYIDLRGLENLFLDMVDAPNYMHEVLAFLTEGHRGLLRQLVAANLLSLNNDGSYQNSGGVGYSDELPAAGYAAERIRPCDLWGSAQSQECALISPTMHHDFFMRYEAQLIEPFGLTGYGCCEDLTRKLDAVMALPHMRRISISPFADVDICAAKLKGRFIFSWKPNPAHLVGDFDEDAIRRYVRHTLDVAAANGSVLEMILKDTHTCEHRPERFDEWTRIAREEIEAVAGAWFDSTT